MYQLCFYVPASHLESVKQALFAQGAGQIGNYDCCAWQTLGQGQFRPRTGSQPVCGTHDTVETVDEYKVEMVCSNTCLSQVIEALAQSHPYETPAYSVWPLETC
ncbi:MAG: NGG1p interacting factor NIF3 [Legionellales bacterium]|nr:NGG1p interacting factor NIF3 [Legionellales bacterium]